MNCLWGFCVFNIAIVGCRHYIADIKEGWSPFPSGLNSIDQERLKPVGGFPWLVLVPWAASVLLHCCLGGWQARHWACKILHQLSVSNNNCRSPGNLMLNQYLCWHSETCDVKYDTIQNEFVMLWLVHQIMCLSLLEKMPISAIWTWLFVMKNWGHSKNTFLLLPVIDRLEVPMKSEHGYLTFESL